MRRDVPLAAAVMTLLGTVALGGVFTSWAWFLPTAAVIAVVAGVNELVRRSPLPLAVGPLLAGLAGLELVVLLFVRSHALFGVLPSKSALSALAALARQGFDDVSGLAAPVPPHRGLVLLAVVGVGLVALVVDLLAVTMRRPALAGLPFLGLFVVPAAVAPHGLGIGPFLIGAVGFLGLLLADGRDRVARWGRTIAATAPTRSGSSIAEVTRRSPLTALGRRIGAAALGVALVVPVLLPHLGHQIFGRGGNGDGPGAGSGTAVTYNPIVRIKDELTAIKPTKLLTVHSDTRVPDYLRMTTLSLFDGSTWAGTNLSGDAKTRVAHRRLPPVGVTAPSDRVVTHVSVSDLDVRWLPGPYPITQASVKGDWRYDPATATVWSARQSTRNVGSYTVTSNATNATAEMLRGADAVPDDVLTTYTILPPDIPISIVQLAERIGGKQPTEYDKALALQDFFHTPQFHYDTSVDGGNSSTALTDFLFQTKRGFCEQYAAAFGVMARVLHLPTRVAIGFTAGTRQPDGSYVVTTADAHAWPEVYFSGYGWERFEPTPRNDGQTNNPNWAPSTGVTPQSQHNDGSQAGSQGSNKHPSQLPNQRDPDLTARHAAARPAATRTRHVSPFGWVLPTLVVALVLLLLVPAVGRRALRWRRWRRSDPALLAHAAWDEVRDDARDLALPWRASDSPRTAVRRLAEAADLSDAPRNALDRLGRVEERARYAARFDAVDAAALRADAALVRRALYRRVSVQRRVRAWLLPPSTSRWASHGADRVADVLEASDRVWLRAWTRLRGVGHAAAGS